MNWVIPYTKEIELATKIKEITSISLEHEMTINEGEILGNLIVSGEYKAHELSVNKEPFNYTLPFSIDLNENLKKESIEFNISDFSYEILNDNILKIMVEFTVTGAVKSEAEKELEVEKEPLFEKPEESELVVDLPQNKESEDVNGQRANPTEILKPIEDTYKTYHIHYVKASDTMESICKQYQISEDVVLAYNDVPELTPGTKLIIPEDE